MYRLSGFRCAVIVFLIAFTAAARGQMFSIDRQALIARAGLTLNKPVSRSEEGLPIGNGRMGTLLWTEGDTLRMQINRVDVFGNSCVTTSFPQRNSDYCGGCGFVNINFSGPPDKDGEKAAKVFTADRCRQHLSCYDGLATIEGNGVKVEAQAWNEQDVIALRITDDRTAANRGSPISIDLRMLRPPVTKRFNHTATSEFDVRLDRAALTQEFTEGDYYCASSMAVSVSDHRAAAKQIDDQTVRLTLSPGVKTVTVYISSEASFDRTNEPHWPALKDLDNAEMLGFEKLAESNREWWKAFWEKSLVHLHSTDGAADRLEAGYTYFLYIMGSTSRGSFPTKFNGMLWTTGGDRRAWGGQFWGANQSCYYNNSLSAADHLELMWPMFEMYSGMLKSCENAARQQWGSQGAFIPETVAFDGLAPLPDSIAAEMRELYLLRKPWKEMSPEFREYAYTQQPHSSRWNWMVGGRMVDGKWVPQERGSGPYGPVTHIFSRGAKIAYQYWLQYEYTQSKPWLAERAYPILKDVAEFYRNYPNLRKEDDGKYHIHDVNSNEPLWRGQDTDEEIASMMAIFPTAIRAAEILNVDPDLQAAWKEVADNLAPLPRSDNPAAGSANRGGKTGSAGGAPTWVKGLNPVAKGNAGSGSDGNTLPVWFFDLCTLETTGPMRETGEVTAARFVPSPIAAGRRPGVLSKVSLLAATMGRADAVKVLVPAQMEGGSQGVLLANRMDLKEGVQTQGVERMGNAADALATALCQSFPAGPAQLSLIRIFPAWPTDWDADFTLLERGGFLVSSAMRGGKIEFVEVQSQVGGECRIRRPWEGSVVLYRNDSRGETLDVDLLKFDTAKGDDIVLVRPGNDPTKLRRSVDVEPLPSAQPSN